MACISEDYLATGCIQCSHRSRKCVHVDRREKEESVDTISAYSFLTEVKLNFELKIDSTPFWLPGGSFCVTEAAMYTTTLSLARSPPSPRRTSLHQLRHFTSLIDTSSCVTSYTAASIHILTISTAPFETTETPE